MGILSRVFIGKSKAGYQAFSSAARRVKGKTQAFKSATGRTKRKFRRGKL